jgi:hypothetical protein
MVNMQLGRQIGKSPGQVPTEDGCGLGQHDCQRLTHHGACLLSADKFLVADKKIDKRVDLRSYRTGALHS